MKQNHYSIVGGVCVGIIFFGIVVGVGWLIYARWMTTSFVATVQKEIADIDFDPEHWSDAGEPYRVGPVMVFESRSRTGNFNGSSIAGTVSFSSMNYQLPSELVAKRGDQKFTIIVINQSMDFEGTTFVETANGSPKKDGKKIVGGIRRESKVMLLEYNKGKFKRIGVAKINTSTPKTLNSPKEAFSAPGMREKTIDWIKKLPNKALTKTQLN